MEKVAIIFFLIGTLFGCKENDNIIDFDNANSYIYFAYPNPNNREQEKFVDSVYYSFALDEEIGVVQKVIQIPVRVAGVAANTDRRYTFSIDSSSIYDPKTISFSDPIIRANNVVDTLYVTIKKSSDLSIQDMIVKLNLNNDANFMIGHDHNKSIKITYSDVLVEPAWWKSWTEYMGPFHKEVFKQWMQIYYLGADMSPHLTNGTPGPIYYWNNMPTIAYSDWYPITFMYIDVLKRYFKDNVVYPDGDTTKERILLP